MLLWLIIFYSFQSTKMLLVLPKIKIIFCTIKLLVSLLLPISYRFYNFAIAKVVYLKIFASFCIGFVHSFITFFAQCIVITLPTIAICSFLLIKAIAKSNENFFLLLSLKARTSHNNHYSDS